MATLVLHFALTAFVVTLLWSRSVAQTNEEKPVPIITGAAGYFTNVDAGRTELIPEINPVLLIPIGDRWLIESRASIQGEYERAPNHGPFEGYVEKKLDYLQVDYIANRYLTVTAGRFLTPFGIYNERLYPIWIRDLQLVPLIFPIGTGSSNGIMFRGGFPLSAGVNINYATYFSTLSTVNEFESSRVAGGRMGFFFTRPRVEVGASWQKELQERRTNSFGAHFAWQPPPIPLNLRAEYARSHFGSGYWIEGAYRLSQVSLWNKVMRRTEFVARMQQTFPGEDKPTATDEYQFPSSSVRQPDFGLNYYILDGLKAEASYSRWLGKHNWNTWTVGLAYRFAIPLGRPQ